MYYCGFEKETRSYQQFLEDPNMWKLIFNFFPPLACGSYSEKQVMSLSRAVHTTISRVGTKGRGKTSRKQNMVCSNSHAKKIHKKHVHLFTVLLATPAYLLIMYVCQSRHSANVDFVCLEEAVLFKFTTCLFTCRPLQLVLGDQTRCSCYKAALKAHLAMQTRWECNGVFCFQESIEQKVLGI